MHAMSNGLYSAKNPAPSSKTITDSLRKSPDAKYMAMMTREPVGGFYTSEKYTTLDLTVPLTSDVKKVKVFGIYGQEDGLFDTGHIAALKKIIGENNFVLVPNASHNIFIDQQEIFVSAVQKFIEIK
jgi:proline iminopeptidase